MEKLILGLFILLVANGALIFRLFVFSNANKLVIKITLLIANPVIILGLILYYVMDEFPQKFYYGVLMVALVALGIIFYEIEKRKK
ncbi:hypothetical protein IDH44_19540 [Paenibacillus sp. IB182496]|uniref:Uncharacterized protein n=1 Tax=Paenibacillus sabuli TaxID=2772509 RepID=A0A927BWX4_9BACL|nr:hypothetical protein [Paenibacillus sabuli]MBD2847401.1 hypothetical protein [Paenibacillus sabuli]